MAKKPSSKARKSTRSVDKSAVKGGGIMSINKSHTSLWMKIVLIILIVSFVLLFSYGGISGFVDLFNKQPQQSQTSSADPVTQIKTKYDSQVKAFETALVSAPTSYTLLVDLGNVHYDYALALMQAGQTATAALMPAVQEWSAASTTFGKAFKAHKLEKSVGVDYSVSQFYSGETTAAVNTAIAVTKLDSTYAPAFYNLGIFYGSLGKKALAIAAFQRYIVLDPKGTSGNPDYAIQQLKALGGSVPATNSAAPATTTSQTP